MSRKVSLRLHEGKSRYVYLKLLICLIYSLKSTPKMDNFASYKMKKIWSQFQWIASLLNFFILINSLFLYSISM